MTGLWRAPAVLAMCLGWLVLCTPFAGCDVVARFRGETTLSSHAPTSSSFDLPPGASYDKPVDGHWRVIAIDLSRGLYSADTHVPLTLLLVVAGDARGKTLFPAGAEGPAAAWVVGSVAANRSVDYGHFARASDEERSRYAGAARLAGWADIPVHPLREEASFDMTVSLRAAGPGAGPAVVGRFERYTRFHPEYVLALILYPFSILGGNWTPL